MNEEKIMCPTNDMLLASGGTYRLVVLGQSGIIHLVWDEFSVRLRPSEFMRVERLLEVGVVELDLTIISDGRFCLKQPQPGEYQLSLGQIELGLPLHDFLDLVEITYTAARQLDRNLDQPFWQRGETVFNNSNIGWGHNHQSLLH
jgi:hypothetical protein